MELIDYSRSFAINTSAVDGAENNTCRTQLLARCCFTDSDGVERNYFLGKECIGEYVYKEKIAQIPTAEVCIIFSENDSSLLKKFVDHKNDVVQTGEMTVPRKCFDGSYANWTALRFHFTPKTARLLSSPDLYAEASAHAEAIIEATLAGEPLVARTTIETPDDGNVLLEYPIPYMNVHPPENRYQVDVGPILFLDPQPESGHTVERFHLAYIMYNEPDRAEFAFRVPTRVGDGVGETLHYADVVTMDATHQIFALEI